MTIRRSGVGAPSLSLVARGFAAGILGSLLIAQTALSAEIRVLTAGAFKPVVTELASRFSHRTGHTLAVTNDTAGALARRVAAGEGFDVVIATPALIEEFTVQQRVAAGTRRDLARVGIGVAVREEAAKPDISSVAAFRSALLAAPSVAYIDPASGGSSGVYLAGLFARLGIAEAIARKAVLVPGGLVAERVARGEAAIALHQISEILPVAGVTLVGPLPREIQNDTVYAAGIGASARDAAAARDLVAALAGPEAADILSAKGMAPAGPGSR